MPFPTLMTLALLSQANPAPSPFKATVLRTASCKLQIKGEMSRAMDIKTEKGKMEKHVKEQFDYLLVGRLDEESDSTGAVRFRFVPADKQMASGARAWMTFQDDVPVPGKPPIAAESREIQTAREFVFESKGRGQDLVVGSGDLTVRASITSGLAPGDTKKVRSVLSIPLPPQSVTQAQKGEAATLKFNGLSLWAIADAKNAFSTSATVTYSGPSGYGRAKGRVELQFELGKPGKP